MKKIAGLIALLLLAGCGSTDYSCTAPETRDMIKRLYTLKLKESATPQNDTERLLAQYQKQHSPELQATLNGVKSQSVDISGVRLDQIEQLKGPGEDAQTPYFCSARISSAWPDDRIERFRPLGEQLELAGIEVDGNRIEHEINYYSRLEADGSRQAVEIEIPVMRRILLQALFAPSAKAP